MRDKIYDSFTEETNEQPMKEQTIECQKSFQPIVQYSFNENYVRWLEARVVKIENFIQTVCENEIEDCIKAMKEVTDGSEQIYEGIKEFAEYMLRAKDRGWYFRESENPKQQHLNLEEE